MASLHTERPRSVRIVVACLAVFAWALGCGSSVSPNETRKVTEPLPAPTNGGCSVAADCVSGICSGGKCAICGPLDFEKDTTARPIQSGKIVENLYAPVSIRAFMDPLRLKRGLGVAYAASTVPRIAGQGNTLISQASFTDADIVNGFVATPNPQSGPSVFDFDFSEPICTDSLTFLSLDANNLANVDLFDASGHLVSHVVATDNGSRQNVALGGKCGVTRMSVNPLGRAALDDVRICGLGKLPPASGVVPGQSCGVDVIPSSGAVQDPCIGGVVLATHKLRPTDLSTSLALSTAASGTLCVRLAGETHRAQSVALNGQNLTLSDDGVSPLEVRAPVGSGPQTVVVRTGLGLHDVDVTVLSTPGAFDSRIPVRKHGLLVTNTDESPDVLHPGGHVTFTATARVGQLSLISPTKFFYDFRVYAPDTCAVVATISGSVDATPGVPATFTATWDGKDASGNMRPDGDYLWDVHVAAIPTLDPDDRVDVTSGFRSARIFGQVSAAECRQRIRDAIAAANLPDPNSRFDVMRDLLRCGADSASACDIDFFTVVNLQRRQEADLLIGDRITPAEYMHFSLDRSRKEDNSDQDPTWTRDFCLGDADGDLVPDSRDLCPGTPPLTATDDHGCTDTNLPDAPSREDVHKVLAGMEISYAPACPNEQLPRLSRIISACQTDDKMLHVVVEPEGSMPDGCPVWYVVRGAMTALTIAPGSFVGEIQKAYVEFALGPPMIPTKRIDLATGAVASLEFQISADQLRSNLVPAGTSLAAWGRFTASVQTLTGAGQRSQIGPAEPHGVPRCGPR